MNVKPTQLGLVGAANGLASLDGAGKVPTAQLPASPQSIDQLYQNIIASDPLVAQQLNIGVRPASPIALPGSPSAQALTFDGTNIWVGDATGSNVFRVNTVTGVITTVPLLGSIVFGMCFDGAHVWATCGSTNNMMKIDPVTLTVQQFTTGNNPQGIIFDGTNIWVPDYNAGGGNTISKYGTNGLFISQAAVGTGPIHMAFDGTNVWVTCQTSNNIYKVNATTMAVSGPFAAGSSNPTHIIYAAGFIHVTAINPPYTLFRFNLSGAQVGSIVLPFQPHGMSYDGTTLWISQDTANVLLRVDPTTYTIYNSTAPQVFFPRESIFDGTNIWACSTTGGSLTYFRPATELPALVPQYTGRIINTPSGVVSSTTFTTIPAGSGFSIGAPTFIPKLVLFYAVLNAVVGSNAVFNVRIFDSVSSATLAEARVTPPGAGDVSVSLFAAFVVNPGTSNSIALQAKFDVGGPSINFGGSIPGYFGLII